MIILAIDTTTEQASVALRKDGVTIGEEAITVSGGHSHLLYEMIRSVLDKVGILLEQVDCFACAIGPGSFTGVRLGVAAAKGLAEATGKPAAGISNLRALASFGTAPFRSPLIDARRGQTYAAVYDSNLVLVSPETLTGVEEWETKAGVERITTTPALAAAIALCAELDGPEKWVDPAGLDASYVRRADADMQWIDKGAIER